MSVGRMPTEAEILRVMEQTGMGRMQAFNHLVQRFRLADKDKRGARVDSERDYDEV